MERSEIEIINDKVSALVKHNEQQEAKNKRLIESIKTNQNRFYHWQNLEKLMDSVMHESEEAVFAYIEKNLGKGMLKAVLKKYIPAIKEELKNTIEKQIEIIKPTT